MGVRVRSANNPRASQMADELFERFGGSKFKFIKRTPRKLSVSQWTRAAVRFDSLSSPRRLLSRRRAAHAFDSSRASEEVAAEESPNEAPTKTRTRTLKRAKELSASTRDLLSGSDVTHVRRQTASSGTPHSLAHSHQTASQSRRIAPLAHRPILGLQSLDASGAMQMMLYLNYDTYLRDAGQQLAMEIRVALANKLNIVMIHENDPERAGCEFARFFATTPDDLICDGLCTALSGLDAQSCTSMRAHRALSRVACACARACVAQIRGSPLRACLSRSAT